ncbi:hypothetical protein B0H17DRAFT_1141402 [Mycena rosella]|uniref:Uncharacterized protein n=1 Tax=Mycena rosella TaxID=1033263 RepID=A0AAD7CZN7_MYCRO|nr:hypothetical protein B0H17DRAFT_1141402 [Mycena rosella]
MSYPTVPLFGLDNESRYFDAKHPPNGLEPTVRLILVNPTLEKLGETSETTLQDLDVKIPEPTGCGSKSRLPIANPGVLSSFHALTQLTWSSPAKLPFSTPAPASTLFGMFPLARLHTQIYMGQIEDVDVSTSVAFIQRHGSKLLSLSASFEILSKIQVFHVCTSLNNVIILYTSSVKPERNPYRVSNPSQGAKAQSQFKTNFATLDTISFPVLKEIQILGAEWPTSE